MSKAKELVQAMSHVSTVREMIEQKCSEANIELKLQDDDLAEVMDVYANVLDDLFSEQEIDELIVFFNTPTGKSFAKKTVAMTQLMESRAMPALKRMMERVEARVDAED